MYYKATFPKIFISHLEFPLPYKYMNCLPRLAVVHLVQYVYLPGVDRQVVVIQCCSQHFAC